MSPSQFFRRLFEDAALAPRLRLLRLAGRVFVPSYRFNWPQLDWWHNESFTQYLRRTGEYGGMNTARLWTVHQLLRLVATVPGDTAECGVFRGATSYLICDANQQLGKGAKIHHLFDSFEGLSEPGSTDGSHWARGDMKCDELTVRKVLADFPDIETHRGWIPERFPDVAGRSFSFVHIDVDLAEPTRQSLEFFYPRMQAGGIIVCDDYGMTTCPGATQVIDDFLGDKPEKMLRLPAGGGFFIQGRLTAPSAQLDPASRKPAN